MNCLYRKTVNYIQEFDPHIVHAMHINNWGALIAARDYNIPAVLSAHALELKNKSLAQTAISDAGFIHTPSEFTSGLIRDIQPGVEPYIVPPAIDLDKYRSKRISGGSDSISGPVVCIARFVDRKNIETVIEAWQKVSNIIKRGKELVVVGDGPHRSEIMSRANHSSDIRFPGYVSEEEKRQLLSDASVFVLVPRRSGFDVEGFGIVFIEAQAAGTPIVGSENGGVPEAIGDAGILVDNENDPHEVAHAVEKLLTDENLRDQILDSAHKRISKFEIEQVSSDHVQRYQELLDQK